MRCGRASRLFSTYDKDGSGSIDADEFLVIMQAMDPGLVLEDVQHTFSAVGASGSLDEAQFSEWCTSMFGDFEDAQFVQQIQELLSVATQQNSSKMSTQELENGHTQQTSEAGAEDRPALAEVVDASEALRREW